ncbi:MAG: penicillin-insensitive murein endopeptidase [Cyanobacteria bacterium J06642_2]
MKWFVILPLILLPFGQGALAEEPSTCFGTTADGRLENGWKLPLSGENFQTYSRVASLAGRTYVHSTVHRVILEAYAKTREARQDTIFVYGETGLRNGGEFKPHQTHRNGLSVDFMVPIRDEKHRSVPIPTHFGNWLGYDLEFSDRGQLDNLRIDFEAMAEHLYQLHQAALNHGIDIWRVIFDPELQPFLAISPRWEYLQQNLQFSSQRSWVRHDQHYHVDFSVDCEPLP